MLEAMPDESNESPSVVVDTAPGPDPLLGREVGGYRIEAPLSEGGMGVVYRARHPFLGRAFAVKVMRPELARDNHLSNSFMREAQTLSGLKHPNIIDIVGFGPLDEQRHYMVMEFLEGRTLEEEFKERGALDVHRVLALADPILSALEAAHSLGVIHRDLKPSNVFLARISGGGEVVKLLDFGLAKLQPHALTGATDAGAGRSVIAGTPEYISPEQALGHPASQASDLYSFGVMLFELLTGRPLFRYASDDSRIGELLRQHVHDEAPTLSAAGLTDAPEPLEQLIRELLRKDPAARPASAAVVRQRLRRIQRHLQQHATRQARNPFTTPPEPSDSPSAPRPPDTTPPDAETSAPAPHPRWPVMALGSVVLLLAAALLFDLTAPRDSSPGAPTHSAGGAAPLAPGPSLHERVEATPASDRSTPAPDAPQQSATDRDTPDIDDELTPLSPVRRRRAPVRRAPEPAVEVARHDCEPDDAWRAAAQRHLQELQQLAATRDATAWSRFQSIEPSLARAITSATDGAQCDAVERRIRQLARELSP